MALIDAPSKRGQIANKAERDFARDIERAGKTWIYQPRTFRLPPPLRSYRPDFYVIEDRCFYEVCGTRQAYSYSVQQITAFRREYPKLRLRVVNGGAWKNGPVEPRINGSRRRRPHGGRDTITRLTACPAGSLPHKLAVVMRALGVTKLSDFARHSGWSYARVQAVSCGYTRARDVARVARDIDAIVASATETASA